eukprot:TRINITY_DN7457_c0_g1_i3.p1 TRINITY_DN7457_c0_g1~~TRINITY_DN7457_c0_g1_i3.p1  ORF type:complete len:353 (+),score=37.90 TRINITY_DN7457_c0_g1_i3:94-1152(+)
MLPAIGAVAGGFLVTSKVQEALRSRKANATMKSADLPGAGEDYTGASEAVLHDETGARVRALERPDAVELYTREYLVHSGVEQHGVVVLVHGFSWHSGYWEPFAKHLQQKGFVVVCYDLRGHGKSGAVDGLRGYASSFNVHVEDLLAVLQWTSERHVGLPLFIFGESMGGSIVLSLMTQHADADVVKAVQGVALACPVLQINPKLLPPRPVLAVMGAVSLAFPKLPLPNEVEKTFEDAFGDKDFAAEARHDPLVVFDPPRLRDISTLISALRRMLPLARKMQTPWLIIQGQLDTRIEPRHAVEFHVHSTCEDKTLKQYPDAHHQMFQDIEDVTQRAMTDFSEWFLDRANLSD